MKPIDRQILRLALPSIFANITVPLVGMADIAVAGHLNGETASLIGGITIGSMLFDLLYWNFAFLRAGTGGLTAQAYGRGDLRAAAETFVRAVGIALLSALALILLQWVFVRAVFGVVDCSATVRSLAEQYFFIRIWAAPATLSLMAFKGWFIGMQDTVSPMAADLLVNLTNIGMSILLAFRTSLGFAGIAWGTVIAQYLGLFFCCFVVLTRYRHVLGRLTAADVRTVFRGGETRRFFRTNGDLLVRSLCFIGIYIGFTLISARYGDPLLAASSIIMKLMLFFSYFTDGFAYAGEALTGKFIGREDRASVGLTVRHTFAWSMGIGLLFVLMNGVAAGPLFRLMTGDPQVAGLCHHFIIWLILMPLVGCPAFTWDGIYIGATATRAIRNSALWALLAFFAVWLGARWLGGIPAEAAADASCIAAIHWLMLAYLAHLAARALSLTLTYRRAILRPMLS